MKRYTDFLEVSDRPLALALAPFCFPDSSLSLSLSLSLSFSLQCLLRLRQACCSPDLIPERRLEGARQVLVTYADMLEEDTVSLSPSLLFSLSLSL